MLSIRLMSKLAPHVHMATSTRLLNWKTWAPPMPTVEAAVVRHMQQGWTRPGCCIRAGLCRSRQQPFTCAAAGRKSSPGTSSDAGRGFMSDQEFEALMSDETELSDLKSKLLGQMKQAVEVEKSEAGFKPSFDSDEYDYAELGQMNPAPLGDILDMGRNLFTRQAGPEAAAQVAADALGATASKILETLNPGHAHPRTPGSGSSGTRGNPAGSSNSSSKGTLETKGGKGQPKLLKLGASSSTKGSAVASQAAASSRGGSSRAGQLPDKKGGSSSSSSKGGGKGGGVDKRDGSTKEPFVIPETAIGRVAESLGRIPVAVLKKGKARLFEAGSPMVYGGAVDCVIGQPPPSAGDVVVVADSRRTPIAWGMFNPTSMFRVRIMQHEPECLADDSVVLDMPGLIRLRVAQAVELRRGLGLPSGETNVVRLINNEGDRLSGITADQLGDTVVVQSSSAWSERYRQDISAAIEQYTGCSSIVWRPAVGILKEEGIKVADDEAEGSIESVDERSPTEGEDSTSSSSSIDGSGSSSSGDGTVTVLERGIKFLASPRDGQKTGFYADQRDSRAFMAGLAKGKTLLDLCCYSGGFAISAAAAGALAVTGVDSSAAAIDLATRNAALNGLADRAQFFKDDVSAFLRAAVEAGEAWDIVVLDPPKLAPNRATLQRASYMYRQLNMLALSVVRPDGLLMTCSCSGAMTQSGGLPKVVAEAAAKAERQVTLVRKAGAAGDHPLHPSYPEGEYLTNLTYRVY